MQAWAGVDAARFKAPPDNWVPPFGAGFARSEGAQPLQIRPWRAAGDDDESYFDREMTAAELDKQQRDTLAAADAVFKQADADQAALDAQNRII